MHCPPPIFIYTPIPIDSESDILNYISVYKLGNKQICIYLCSILGSWNDAVSQSCIKEIKLYASHVIMQTPFSGIITSSMQNTQPLMKHYN